MGSPLKVSGRRERLGVTLARLAELQSAATMGEARKGKTVPQLGEEAPLPLLPEPGKTVTEQGSTYPTDSARAEVQITTLVRPGS